MSATAMLMPLKIGVVMTATIGRQTMAVLNKSDAMMIEGFPLRWLGVVSWLQRVSDRWEAVPR